jgi:hypothetical protein
MYAKKAIREKNTYGSLSFAMASAEDTTVAAPPSQKKSCQCQAQLEKVKLACAYPYRRASISCPIHITVNIHDRIWTEGTYRPRLQTDSSGVECDTFPDESEGLSRWVGGAFIVTTHSSSFNFKICEKDGRKNIHFE